MKSIISFVGIPLILSLLLELGTHSVRAADRSIPFQAALESSAIKQDRLDNILENSLILGNGDINALVYSTQSNLTLNLTKNDVWDARVDSSEDPDLLKVDVAARKWTGGGGSKGYGKSYPCPRICARLVLTLAENSSTNIVSELDLRRAVAKIGGSGETIVRALAQRNVFLVQSPLQAKLEPVVVNCLPAAESGETEGVQWLRQQLPGDLDWLGMSFVVALASGAEQKAVAIVTSLESKDPMATAVRLARTTAAQSAPKLIAEHESVWAKFWSASGIDIGDEFLRSAFYRNLYFLRCVSKPGVQAVGLYAGLINNNPGWHGDYHSNYNEWQTFWASYICNHVELAEPFERLVFEYLPRGRWFARETYDCGGACFPISLFAYEPVPGKLKSKNQRSLSLNPWAYTIGQGGWMVQNLWSHYLYQPDRDYLKRIAYPAVREVALFYADFIDKCQANASGRLMFGPSYSPEHRGFGIDNCPCDIAYARFSFKAAITGAGILDRDAELAARFKRQLARLPEYPVTDEPEPMVTDVEGGKPVTYNIAVPALPVFPADQVTVFSPPDQVALFRRTLERVKWNGYNSSVMMPVARARLSFPDSAEYMKAEFLKRSRPNGTITLLPGDGHGHFTEQFAASGAIAELLLQSVGDILRVFPAWPKEKAAAFTNLRAQGGFLVSAELTAGKVVKLEIVSTVGGPLRLVSPWPAIKLAGRELKPDEHGVVAVKTREGERLVFVAGQTGK